MLQQARIKLGQAGATAVTFRQGRLAVTPIELDSVRAKALRAEIPGVLYESGKSQLSMRVPDDPAERFPAVVRAADALEALRLIENSPATLDSRDEERRICLALGAFFVPAAIFAGCGGVPGNSVATVDGSSIDEERLRPLAHRRGQVRRPERRGRAQAARATRTASSRSARRRPKPAKGQPKVTDAQLKTQCKQEYDALRDQVLQLLVSFKWIEGEAKAQDIKVSDTEVKKSFDKQKKESFPKDADFEKFLKDSGQTEDDILKRVRLDVLSNKIREKVTKGKDKVTDAEIADLLQQEQGSASRSPSGATCGSS